MAERKRKRPALTGPHSSSPVKSDKSSDQKISPGTEQPISSQMRADGSTSPSILSMKSDGSMFMPMNFGNENPERSQMRADGSRSPSILSMKSDGSMFMPMNFSNENPERSDWDQSDSPAAEPRLKKPRQDPEYQRDDTGDTRLLKAKKKLKEAIKKKCTSISEGNGDQQSLLNKIYTELYITTGESEGPQAEHEFGHLERKKTEASPEGTVSLSDIFKPLPGQEKLHRTVLTKGSAGIGKSFSVQKFILDWAEEKENQDIDFVFCLAFKEMNLSTDTKSLDKLLTEFHPALNSLNGSTDYVKTNVLVILDGLDESRLQLDFESNKTVTSVSEVTSLSNLLSNLIQGTLLPNAKLWITSRKVAANQIPAKYVDMVTEIRGFNESQKEEYFRKRFSDDLTLAKRIISHIQSSVSLDIMCQIPIFCWISSVLFQDVFSGDGKAETPQTLTEMMAHFLFVQTKRRSRKYDQKKTKKKEENLLKTHREFLLKLGKLAFVHLQKNNLIFYEEDLENCGIDINEASIHSGFCTTVLREEEIFSQRRVFSFVHLTIQEFFAALYVYDCFTNKNTTELSNFLDVKDKEHTLLDLLKMTVEKVLEKKNGHLVYFLRMLFGLVVETNRRVLQGLLTSPDPSQDTEKKILTYLKSIRRKTLSPDNCISLFQTMVEMRDQKVKDEIQEYLMLKDRSKTELTPMHCSALAYMLQVSKKDVDILDLKTYNTSDEGRRRLIPAVKSSRKAILADCKVTKEWVEHLALDLKFPNTPLRELDLSNNDLKDEGVKLLCDGLSSQCCKLEILRLSGCMVTETACGFLASALKSNPSHLRELDLSYNHPGDSGVKLLLELKDDPQYKLSILNVEHGGKRRMIPGFKKYACELTLDPNTAHKNLRISDRNRKVTWVEEEQSYPDHPERFDQWPQVLFEQGLNERCYWEFDVLKPFNIGVTYRSIERKGDVNDCKLGRNNKSWSLNCYNAGCFVLHGSERITVSSLSSRSSRVGLYLDWPAGTLSFYRVSSDSRIRLHTFKTTFDEPLYPAVELRTHSSALLCKLT
ncbi:NACHT, LRR and PYD domains-containing protein 3-like isoform X1 [Seriola aureovittata]|uniref:NACHT, LRR and PYD domains-containing protein 3-like isoform X1 n=2 Tax=Seriola TaxID=8160 RepID=UPI0024BE341B|nr:NACHT, LRR and PYD domains-containing protein 3-like isoform X1 [Seriola aureovittata]XP_056224687.1 NACHT, LRR and PYD domains-containing protein 3-like isoform X1 [Seriola aureovittata]XP_056224688.1 NACHT, LRR and PYD domains-containing protein 3-like isoform X1 [Seriola aureovittata]